MPAMTPELKQAVKQVGDGPVKLTDPETNRSYVLLSAEIYERLMAEDDRRERGGFLRRANKNAQARLVADERLTQYRTHKLKIYYLIVENSAV
jgi:PHD/YefM family antitoxin component YafN of YafNO toxin-antitoxin module